MFCVNGPDEVTGEFFQACNDVNEMKQKTGIPSRYSDDIEEPVEKPDWDESFNPPVCIHVEFNSFSMILNRYVCYLIFNWFITWYKCNLNSYLNI